MSTRITVLPVPAGVDIIRCPECDHSNEPDSVLTDDGGALIMSFRSAEFCYECGHDLADADLDPDYTIGGVAATVLGADVVQP